MIIKNPSIFDCPDCEGFSWYNEFGYDHACFTCNNTGYVCKKTYMLQLAELICDVQPMTAQSGQIFNFKYDPAAKSMKELVGSPCKESCCVGEGCLCFGMGHQFETCEVHRYIEFKDLRYAQRLIANENS